MAQAAKARDRKLIEARAALDANRRRAVQMQQQAGLQALRALLERAQRDLDARLQALTARGADDTFTAVQARATLKQVELVLRQLVPGVSQTVIDSGVRAADQFAAHTAEYLRVADEAYRGAGTQPLALSEASMMESAMQGARSSILRRISASGEDHGVDRAPHAAKPGVLGRYGAQTIEHFEKTLQAGVVARKTRAEMAEDLRNDSPFLRGAPAHWAERIVRTELHHAANAAGLRALKDADEQLGDMLKVLSCVFDDRTGADSIAVHGQIRRAHEPFETWFGPCDHPPDRPNDRAVVTPHRMSWPLPEALRQRPWEEVLARWKLEGHKKPPPERPEMSTVDVDKIGAEEPEEKPAKAQEQVPEDLEPKPRDTKEWAGEAHDAFQGVLDDKPLESFEAAAKSRGLLREVLGRMGLRSFDVERNALGRDSLQLMEDDPKALAYHNWNGAIQIRKSEMAKAVRAVKYAREDEVPMPEQQRALLTLVHEEVHGASPGTRDAYRGIGVAFEESGTEILARRATREMLRLDPAEHRDLALPKFEWVGRESHMQSNASERGGAYDGFIMRIQKRVMVALGRELPVDEANRRIEDAFVEIRTARGAEFRHPADQADAFCRARALGLTEKQREELREKIRVEFGE